MSETEEQLALFDDYRRNLARGTTDPPPAMLDPHLAALAQGLAPHLKAAAPDSAFIEALRQRLQQEALHQRVERKMARPPVSSTLAELMSMKSRKSQPYGQRIPALVGGRQILAIVAYAALLVIVTGGALMLLQHGAGRQAGIRPPYVGLATPVAHATTSSSAAQPPQLRDEILATAYPWVIDGERVDRSPQLSPDGRYAVYFPQLRGQATTHLIVRDLQNGDERDLTADPTFAYVSARWSPDSHALAFIRYRPTDANAAPTELWRMDADGQHAVLLHTSDPTAPPTRGPALTIRAWSADGRYITTEPTIWTVSPRDGAPLRVFANGDGGQIDNAVPANIACGSADTVGPQWRAAPDGSYALCIASGDSNIALMRYDDDSGQTRALVTSAGQITLLAISPDSEWIAFQKRPPTPTSNPARLWVVRRDGTGLREVGGEPYYLVQAGRVVWGAAGQGYFIGLPADTTNQVTGYIYTFDAATASAHLVTTKWRTPAITSVSRDGQHLLVVRGSAETGGIWWDAEIHLLEILGRGESR
jgi:Tol biopolymer transport system component